MDARLAWTLGLLGVGAVVVGGVAIAHAAVSQPAPSGTPGPNGKPCPRGGVVPLALLTYTVKYAQTGTTQALQVGDLLVVSLLRSGTTPWEVKTDDDSVLQPEGTPTTQTDALGGVSDVITFKAVAQGNSHVIGGAGGQTFKLTVNINCPG